MTGLYFLHHRQLVLFLLIIPTIVAQPDVNVYGFKFPERIHLRAGVIHKPPLAFWDRSSSSNGTPPFAPQGLQIELLESLQVFAAQDGVNLTVDLEPSPPLYTDAFDLIANDCNTTRNRQPLEECSRFDLIIGDYYSTAERYMRANLSPSWLKTALATIKNGNKTVDEPDYTLLSDAEEAQATICVPAGTYLATVVRDKYPKANYLVCDPNEEECTNFLKQGNCVLYVDDELATHYMALQDPSFAITGENFLAQFYVWPMSYKIPDVESKLFFRWMYMAVQNATVEELYYKFYKRERCPLGTAGIECELPCDANHGRADSSGSGQCVCSSSRWTGDDCSVEVEEDLNLLPPQLKYTMFGLAGINFLLVGYCACWLFKNRFRNHVAMAQPTFLGMILVGCLFSTSTIFAMAQEDEGDIGGPVYACMFIPWLYSIGFSLTFGAMFARIRRIYMVLQSAVECKKVTISSSETILTALVVLLFDVVVLITWTAYDPLTWIRVVTVTDQFGIPLESEGYCYSDHWVAFTSMLAAFHLILMGVACHMCYLSRKIPARISNGKYVGIAMLANLQILITATPVLFIMGSPSENSSFFIRSIAIWINDFVVVSLIFGNLMFQVWTFDQGAQRDKNSMRLSRINSHKRISKDLNKYAQMMRGISSKMGFSSNFASTRPKYGGSPHNMTTSRPFQNDGKMDASNNDSSTSSHPSLRDGNFRQGTLAAPDFKKGLRSSKGEEGDVATSVSMYDSADQLPMNSSLTRGRLDSLEEGEDESSDDESARGSAEPSSPQSQIQQPKFPSQEQHPSNYHGQQHHKTQRRAPVFSRNERQQQLRKEQHPSTADGQEHHKGQTQPLGAQQRKLLPQEQLPSHEVEQQPYKAQAQPQGQAFAGKEQHMAPASAQQPQLRQEQVRPNNHEQQLHKAQTPLVNGQNTKQSHQQQLPSITHEQQLHKVHPHGQAPTGKDQRQAPVRAQNSQPHQSQNPSNAHMQQIHKAQTPPASTQQPKRQQLPSHFNERQLHRAQVHGPVLGDKDQGLAPVRAQQPNLSGQALQPSNGQELKLPTAQRHRPVSSGIEVVLAPPTTEEAGPNKFQKLRSKFEGQTSNKTTAPKPRSFSKSPQVATTTNPAAPLTHQQHYLPTQPPPRVATTNTAPFTHQQQHLPITQPPPQVATTKTAPTNQQQQHLPTTQPPPRVATTNTAPSTHQQQHLPLTQPPPQVATSKTAPPNQQQQHLPTTQLPPRVATTNIAPPTHQQQHLPKTQLPPGVATTNTAPPTQQQQHFPKPQPPTKNTARDSKITSSTSNNVPRQIRAFKPAPLSSEIVVPPTAAHNNPPHPALVRVEKRPPVPPNPPVPTKQEAGGPPPLVCMESAIPPRPPPPPPAPSANSRPQMRKSFSSFFK